MAFHPPHTSDSDREADEYELRLHRTSATRGLLLGGALTTVAVAIFLLTGIVYLGMLLVPGIALLVNAMNHRSQGNVLAARLAGGASIAHAQAPAHGAAAYRAAAAPAPVTLERGSRVVVTWSDQREYPGFILQSRGQHYLVQLEEGRQEWVPSQHVRPG